MDGEFRLIFKVDREHHPVDFCHKSVLFGGLPLRQVWVDVRTLYQPTETSNSAAMLAYFWALCRTRGTARDPAVQDSYLLARLLPFSRELGSRRIVADGRFGPASAAAYAGVRAAALSDLQRLLTADRDPGMPRLAFRDRTARLLGIPEPDEETVSLYHQFCENLFGDARALVADDPEWATVLMLRRWDHATRRWGRRRGHKRHKRVMDFLSYECRAAFHRCYSAFWIDAMEPIGRHLGMDRWELRFMHLWHLDHASEGQSPGLPFHWFHGHVLGLHPASGLLTATAAGQQILADYLRADSPDCCGGAFGHLLRAIHHAIYVYMNYRDGVAQSRRASI